MGKKITIKDVAKHSGVSIATVSLILNGNEAKFSPKTVESLCFKKGIRVSARLSCPPDDHKRNKTIGVLVPDITNPFFNILMRGIEEVLYQQHFVTILCNADSDHQKEIEYLAELTRRGVDGFIIATSAISTSAINENLKSMDVLTSCSIKKNHMDSVTLSGQMIFVVDILQVFIYYR